MGRIKWALIFSFLVGCWISGCAASKYVMKNCKHLADSVYQCEKP